MLVQSAGRPTGDVFGQVLLGLFARLPEWTRTLSPVDAVGELPRDDPSPLALGVIAALTVAVLTAALARADRRDLREG